MSCNNKCGFTACSCIGILISIVFGAIIGILFAFDLITFITTLVWVAFGFGVLALILLIVGIYFAAVAPESALRRCLCQNVTCLLAGSIGTIIASLIALAIPLVFTSIFAIIIVAITAFFFALLLIGLIAYINCIVCRLCLRTAD